MKLINLDFIFHSIFSAGMVMEMMILHDRELNKSHPEDARASKNNAILLGNFETFRLMKEFLMLYVKQLELHAIL
jgi:hypothetical protein